MHASVVTFSLLGFAVARCAASGSGNVLALSHLVIDNPGYTLMMTLLLIAITVILETILHQAGHFLHHHHLHHVIALANKVLTEVMFLGVIGLGLTFVGNFVHNKTLLEVFNWVHMLLFLMAVVFVFFIALLFLLSHFFGWRKFERIERDLEQCVALHPGGHDGPTDQATLAASYADMGTFVFAHMYIQWKADIVQVDPQYQDVSFTRYLIRGQRKYLVKMVELHWSAWLVVALAACLNSSRYLWGDRLRHAIGAVLGSLTLISAAVLVCFLAIYVRFILGMHRFRKCLRNDPSAPVGEEMYRKFFLFSGKSSSRGKHFTLAALQCCLLGNVYFITIMLLMASEFRKYFNAAEYPLHAAALIASLVAPCVVLWLTVGLLCQLTLVLCTGPHLKQKVLKHAWFEDVWMNSGERHRYHWGILLQQFEDHEIEDLTDQQMRMLLTNLRTKHTPSEAGHKH
eukprot:TRINITY_DN801_c0_g1_i1.p1 TRINITY_DN801_c0_g1~~TRINITY_DN801_c0_g1_i1.p1  ORF type:complete len:457 (+),score=66.35 TRINITY_DN801_c0_g1_i1:59-1429(+)